MPSAGGIGTVATSAISPEPPVTMAVAVNATGEPESPATAAWAVWTPAWPPRVNTVAATPLESVADEAGDTLPPPAVTLHVTDTPGTGLASASVTRTRSGCGRAGAASACWLLPSNAEISVGVRAGGGAVESLQESVVRASRSVVAAERINASSRVSCWRHAPAFPAAPRHSVPCDGDACRDRCAHPR